MRITNDDKKPSLLNPEELAHYGVLGMKWGVRRDQRSLDRAAGRSTKKAKRAEKKAEKKAAKSRPKTPEELKKRKERQQAGAAAAASALAIAGILYMENEARNEQQRSYEERNAHHQKKYQEQIYASISWNSREGNGSDWLNSPEGQARQDEIYEDWSKRAKERGAGPIRR